MLASYSLLRPTVRTAILLLSTLAIAAVTSTAARAEPIAERQSQAASLDAQVTKLEERYGDLQERTRGSRIELATLQSDAREVRSRLRTVRVKLERAQQRLQLRAVAMYQGDSSSMLVEFTAAGSMSDVFDRIDAARRISQQDATLLTDVRDLKSRVAAQESKLRITVRRKQKLTSKLERDSTAMASVLAKRRSALASAQADVRQLMEQQRRAAAAHIETSSRARARAIATGTDPVTDSTTPQSTTGTTSQPASIPAPAESSASTPSSSTPIPLPPGSGTASNAANIAMGKIGSPYVWAAAGPSSFDCSGLVVWAFAQAGRSGLPHSTYSLIGMGIEVPMSQAQPGDLVFTNNTGHMGIYVGGGNMVHSPRTGRTVSVEPLTYYSVVAIRRI